MLYLSDGVFHGLLVYVGRNDNDDDMIAESWQSNQNWESCYIPILDPGAFNKYPV